MQTTKQIVKDLAADAGLKLRIWNPGDGMSRYEITHGDRTLATCSGARDATQFIRAFIYGRSEAANLLAWLYRNEDEDGFSELARVKMEEYLRRNNLLK